MIILVEHFTAMVFCANGIFTNALGQWPYPHINVTIVFLAESESHFFIPFARISLEQKQNSHSIGHYFKWSPVSNCEFINRTVNFEILLPV